MRPLLGFAMLLIVAGASSAQTPQTARETEDSRLANRFRQADTNGDGFISAVEARTGGLWFQDDFSGVDADRSGTVTLFELSQALQQRLRQSLSDFDAADVDHDGRLSAEEAQRSPSVASVLGSADPSQYSGMSRPEYESYALDRLHRDGGLPAVAPNIIEKRF